MHFAENYQHLGSSTRSGLWYSMLEKGEDAKVRKGVGVKVKFLGYLNDGVVFGENFTGNAAFSFTAGQGSVIKAWEETLSLIGPGGKVFLGVPPNLAYGKLGKAPFIGPQDTLFYYFELTKATALSQ